MAAILVVDDDETVRDMLYDLFESDHLCHAAETVEQALVWLETEFYDVVLTDISLPGMSGVELLELVKQHQPDTPVIIISGTSDQDYARSLIEMGASDYLVKPFRLEHVEERVNLALEERHRLLEERRRGAV